MGTRRAGAWDIDNIRQDDKVNGYVPPKPRPKKPPKPPKNPHNGSMNALEGALGAVTNNTANQPSIGDKWDNLTKSQTAKRKAQHDAEVTGYEQQRALANQEYAGMKNQATVSRAMQEEMRKENMVNMGMSGSGGTSRTYAQRNTNNLNNQLGGISKQQMDLGNNIDFALGNAGSLYDADVMSIAAQNAASASTEQMQYNQWKADSEARQKDATSQHILAMLKAKMITKDQAREMIGIDL